MLGQNEANCYNGRPISTTEGQEDKAIFKGLHCDQKAPVRYCKKTHRITLFDLQAEYCSLKVSDSGTALISSREEYRL